jgi:hypothetical protein
MSEMVERVKTAIAEKLAPAIDLRAPYAKVMVEAAARAAIEAMREPTEAMLDTMWDTPGDPRTQWISAIDEALK